MSNLILVVGGTSGIGLETANYLSKKDYQVIVCGRRQLKSDNFKSIKANLKSDNSIKDLYCDVKNNFGNINGLIYSAGVTVPKKTIEEFDGGIWHDIIDTNVTGLLRVLKYFYPSLKETKGKVVVVNSISTRLYSQFSGYEYVISKAALSGLVRQFAFEWTKDGVFINSVFPSMTMTPMLKENLKTDEINLINKKLPLKKLATPADTARAIEFLINKENKYITGTGIDISGGQYFNG